MVENHILTFPNMSLFFYRFDRPVCGWVQLATSTMQICWYQLVVITRRHAESFASNVLPLGRRWTNHVGLSPGKSGSAMAGFANHGHLSLRWPGIFQKMVRSFGFFAFPNTRQKRLKAGSFGPRLATCGCDGIPGKANGNTCTSYLNWLQKKAKKTHVNVYIYIYKHIIL